VKIVSGGQTGADRAALDFALEAQILCGGWCAEDRVAEDGVIPGQYPVVPLPGADNAARTRQNVLDSDATVIFFAQMQAGTELTRQAAVEARKPLLLIDASGWRILFRLPVLERSTSPAPAHRRLQVFTTMCSRRYGCVQSG
jgi:hypothetical protein